MMAGKVRYSEVYPSAYTSTYDLEGSGSSGRMDIENTASENSSAPRRKWINLNSSSQDGFAVPVQVIRLSKLTPSERKSLVFKLKSELEQTKLLQKKMEAHRINTITVSSTSDILSCSNVQKVPPVKKSSVLTSIPGKKSNSRGSKRGTIGRFHEKKMNDSDVALLKQCGFLLKKVMAHQFGWVFNKPVDVVELNIPDYYNVIKHPMDLGTINTKLSSGLYSNPLEFLSDVRLTFSNAMTYNPPGNDVHIMANTISKFFEARWKPIEKKIPIITSSHLLSELHEEIEIIDPIAPTKKRKLSPPHQMPPQMPPHQQERKVSPVVQNEVMAEPSKRKMSDEEKHNLSRDLEAFEGDFPDNIIEFLKEQSSNGKESAEDEIEIDIDDLSDDTLFTLRGLIDEFLRGKANNNSKPDTCEIELPNDSGLSNSSMQQDKGHDHVDEDIDIGGNEPNGSSYPPVMIEKDTENIISNKNPNAESYDRNSDSDSSSSSDSESESLKASTPVKNHDDSLGDFTRKPSAEDMVDRNYSVSGLDQVEQNSGIPVSTESELQPGESVPIERKVSPDPDKLYRAALLKNRFADTIIKAREKALGQVEKTDPEKLRREMEELEMLKRKEKARLQAEAKAAEDARIRAEAEAVAEAKRQRELERAAARQALLKMEKTVEINETSRFLEDLEMLSCVPLEQLPSSVDENSPDDINSQDGLGSFKFGSVNPLEQLGLYMKVDDEEDEPEPEPEPEIEPEPGLEPEPETEPTIKASPDLATATNVTNDVEEGEID